ncbi:MAG: GNAT family N-acetyltransferase [Planctomycetota bacterium]
MPTQVPLAILNQKVRDSRFSIVETDELPDWDDYVKNHPRGTIFHTRGIYKSFLNSPGTKPVVTAALDARGRIIALHFAVFIETFDYLKRWSTRAVLFAEPICDSNLTGTRALAKLIQVHNKQASKVSLFTEVRCHHTPGFEQQILLDEGYVRLDFDNYLQDLTEDLQVLSKRIKSQARKIKTAHRRGLSISLENSHDGIRRAYQVIQASYLRSRIPCLEEEVFHHAFDTLPAGTMQIRVGTYQGQDVTAGIGLIYGDRYFAWHNGTTRPKGISATASLVWDEIQCAQKLGLKTYDFGGAGWTGQKYGPRTFKSRFKGHKVNHGRYRCIHSKFRLMVAKNVFEIFRKLRLFNIEKSTSSVLAQNTAGGQE